ncbi:DNA-directed RNA polymerase III subunit, HMG-like protein [Scheffersomyces amazonensis]|uniref:DNA-directed RNA polymerase III subunit, HMG-like protein n=1 Tax=Scheffersomyces amazonensis TaxID=1078765 RepID=UPI00315D38A4
MSFRSRGSGRALLPFGLDYSDVLSADNGSEKPQLVLPINGSLNEYEVSSAQQSIAFSQLMIDGPFYTGSYVDPKAEKKQKNGTASNNVVSNTAPDGIQRYSDKYKKVKKIGRSIEEHPYQLEFFPEELYSVMGITNRQKKKLLALSSYKSNGGLKDYSIDDENSESDKAASMLEKLKDMAEELDEDQEGKDEEGDDLEEELDDEFDEDEDDDYNAEKYFDDGEDDGGDIGGNDEAAF